MCISPKSVIDVLLPDLIAFWFLFLGMAGLSIYGNDTLIYLLSSPWLSYAAFPSTLILLGLLTILCHWRFETGSFGYVLMFAGLFELVGSGMQFIVNGQANAPLNIWVIWLLVIVFGWVWANPEPSGTMPLLLLMPAIPVYNWCIMQYMSFPYSEPVMQSIWMIFFLLAFRPTA